MGLTPEGKVTKQIIDYLKTLKRSGEAVWWLKLHGGPMQKAGVPDLLVIREGRHFLFEIKNPGGKATQLQQILINKVNAAGGFATVVHSVDDVKNALEKKLL